MKNLRTILLILCVAATSYNCSSVKVVDAWKSPDANDLKSKNFIVVARTSNNAARIAFENEIVQSMKKRGLQATPSFSKFPPLNKTEINSEDRIKLIKEILGYENFNAVVLISIKDVKKRKVSSGSYLYFNNPWYSYYPSYYGNFYTYYHQPYIYNVSTLSRSSQIKKTFYLESIAFNLEETDDNQIIAVVTTKVEQPKKVYKTASKYKDKILKALDKQ